MARPEKDLGATDNFLFSPILHVPDRRIPESHYPWPISVSQVNHFKFFLIQCHLETICIRQNWIIMVSHEFFENLTIN